MDYASYYSPDTGQIKKTYGGLCIDRMDEIHQGLERIEGLHDGLVLYIKDNILTDRPIFTPTITPTSIPADGASLVTLSDFPEGATLRISGPINAEWVETGTSTELTVNLPGTYRVTIDHWPHQTAEVTFNAT